MNKFLKGIRIASSGLAAIFIFYGWVRLVGPQMHVVETVIGLVLTLVVFSYLLFVTRSRKKTVAADPVVSSGTEKAK